MRLGIVGLPNAGKSTIFNALCGGNAKMEKYPFTTIEPNIGVVSVPDERLEKIAAVYEPKKIVNTAINFVDVAGLVKGANKGEGLGNKFLGNIKEVDAIIEVVRCFNDTEVPHNYGDIDPQRDIGIINTELLLSDLEIVERNVKSKEKARHSDKDAEKAYDALVKIQEALQRGVMLFDAELLDEEAKTAVEYGLLTNKKIIYVLNVSEEDIKKTNNDYGVKDPIILCGKWEYEMSGLDEDSRKMFLEDVGISELGLDKLVKEGYRQLGLVSFFTTESKELKAWTIRSGTKVIQAAGKIHTDMEKGFIRAEVIPFDVLMEYKGPHKVKEAGKLRIEGKEYVVQDGDIIKVHFN